MHWGFPARMTLWNSPVACSLSTKRVDTRVDTPVNTWKPCCENSHVHSWDLKWQKSTEHQGYLQYKLSIIVSVISRTNTRSIIHTYTYIRTWHYIHTLIHTYIHTCIYLYMHISIHAYMHTWMHSYLHTYMNAFIHACITHITDITWIPCVAYIAYRIYSTYIAYIACITFIT